MSLATFFLNLNMMDWNKKTGTKNLESLPKKDIESLVNHFSYRTIAKMFDISVSSSRRILYEKIEEYGIVVRDSNSVNYTPCQEPFSRDEMDYGESIQKRKQIITKQGLLVFEGNAPIRKRMNELSQVAKNYAMVMLNNNQQVKFIKQ